jgi:hypothetical protein
MRKATVLLACLCVAAALAAPVTARTKTVVRTTVDGHVDTVLAPGLVEGTVTTSRGAPAKCRAGRKIQILAEDGTVLAEGRTASNGTYSIQLAEVAQKVRVLGRRLDNGCALTVCDGAEDFISYFVEHG